MGRPGGGRWGPAEDEAFLKALAELGHVARAAAAIGWTARTAYDRRAKSPAFAARWAALRRPPRPPAPTSLMHHRVGQGGTPSRPKHVRTQTPWTPEREDEFLDLLAATCNVRLAAETAGIGSDAVYRRRRQRADFAAKWQAAVEQGYARLEVEFLRACAESVEGCEFAADRMIGPVSADTVLKLLGLHRAAATGHGKRPGARPAPPSLDQVKAEIMRRVAAIRAARQLPKDPPPEDPPQTPAPE